jgi:hypothetical protein
MVSAVAAIGAAAVSLKKRKYRMSLRLQFRLRLSL